MTDPTFRKRVLADPARTLLARKDEMLDSDLDVVMGGRGHDRRR